MMHTPHLGSLMGLALLTATSLVVLSEMSHCMPLDLQDIQFSEGVMSPAQFSPDTSSYTITIGNAEVDSIGVTPIIDTGAYPDGSYPLMSVDGKQLATSIGAQAEVELPSDGSNKNLEVKLCDPGSPSSCKSSYYAIDMSLVTPVTSLKGLTVVDNKGAIINTDPAPSGDVDKYTVVVEPDTEYVTVKANCPANNQLYVDKNPKSNGEEVKITREKDHAKQIVEIDCEVDQAGKKNIHAYVLTVRASPKDDEIPPPDVKIESTGDSCPFRANETRYMCPKIDTSEKVKVVADFDQQYRYLIVNPSRTTEVRLLKGRPTIGFTPASNLIVEAETGDSSAEWPLAFEGLTDSRPPGWLGIFLATLLMLNITSLLSVLTLSNSFGVGSPLGAGEIAATLLFLLQYFCFSDYIRGEDTLLSDLCWKLKWVTLYWPLPWDYGVLDVGKLENAYGCLFWSLLFFVVAYLFHLLLMGKFVLFERDYTFPNRLLTGHWESRVMTFLCFPATTASAFVLWHGDAEVVWIIAAICCLIIYGFFAIISFIAVNQQVSSGNVVWVWASSMREQSEIHDESGYWLDAKCNQLNTEPTNRSIFPAILPWKWVSTVADIEEVTIKGEQGSGGLLTHEEAFEEAGREPSYNLGKSPQSVEVNKTRHPGTCCPQQRLVSGLLRTQWLDVLFTYQGLTKFHSSAVRSYGDNTVVPLTVKTCQLTGPIAGGRLFFFFDGARMPFIRVAEILFRYTIGIFMGITIASNTGWLDAVCFAVICLIALACLIYSAVSCPYTRTIDNWLLGSVLFAVTCSAAGFCIHSAMDSKLELLVDILLWLTIIVCIILALYSLAVTISVFAAVICPPMEETKLLERLCNCEVTIADHEANWGVEVPAYNKFASKDYKAQLNSPSGENVVVYPTGEEPHLEFSVEDMIRACRSNNLRTPLACVYVPSDTDPLKYRHTNIYERGALYSQLTNFLRQDASTVDAAHNVANNVSRQLQSVGNNLAVVTIIPSAQQG
eukprot:GHVN01012365.1.p1 GENE.GHVN01012365.1~~GHVN01012365.1.p1  ORF type:complete len:1002 (-),score=158.24 GHVN01012365.1:416-3421(-)